VQSARYVIVGVIPETWPGPMQPLQPMTPAEVAGRKFDHPTGDNLTTNPRGSDHSGTSFSDLCAVPDNCNVVRAVIEARKDQPEPLDWNIKLKPDKDNVCATPIDDQQPEAMTSARTCPGATNGS
jgi:hypothetical protein